jgi:hypothetical protein
MKKIVFSLLICTLLLSACGTTLASKTAETATLTPQPSLTPVSIIPPTPTETPTVLPTDTPELTQTLAVTPTETQKPVETITFQLPDGTSLEMPKFETAQDAYEYIGANTFWRPGEDSFQKISEVSRSSFKKMRADPETLALFNKINSIGGLQVVFGVPDTFPPDKKGEPYFVAIVTTDNNGKLFIRYNNKLDFGQIQSPLCVILAAI